MVITDRLKQVIFKRLYKELGNAEIIPYNDSIWFIDREKEYWYFEFEKDGRLWWRYGFFINFFEIFSLSDTDFEHILSAWVEEVLNHKVSTTVFSLLHGHLEVEEVLNHKVSTTSICEGIDTVMVEEVLNHKVSTTHRTPYENTLKVEKVLNHKVSTTRYFAQSSKQLVEEVLNHKVSTIDSEWFDFSRHVGEVLNQK